MLVFLQECVKGCQMLCQQLNLYQYLLLYEFDKTIFFNNSFISIIIRDLDFNVKFINELKTVRL